MYKPVFQISPILTKVLIDIDASRQAESNLPITVQVLSSLRESARLVSTHYSTQIKGNRLTQRQLEEVLHGGTFPNRERDECEVKNYSQALDYVDTLRQRPHCTPAHQCGIAQMRLRIKRCVFIRGILRA